MNSDEIYDSLDMLATKSGNAKLAALAPLLKQPHFLQVLNLAMNPFITFGMAKVPERTDSSTDGYVFGANQFDMLDKMAKRELTGNAAKSQVQLNLNALTPKSAELLKRIIKQDLRAGFGISNVNKLVPGTIPVFDVMLAKKYEERHIKSWPVIWEPKMDGVRAVCIVHPHADDVQFLSRTGKPFTAFDMLKEHLLEVVKVQFPNCSIVFDTEVKIGSFNDTVSGARRMSKQATDAELHIFEFMTFEEFQSDDFDMPYVHRRKRLCSTFAELFNGKPLKIVPIKKANSHDEVMAFTQSEWDIGGEGGMIKNPVGRYEKKRSAHWLKVKQENGLDLEVVGLYAGEAGKQFEHSLGGLTVDLDGVEVNVGGGFSERTRAEIWANHTGNPVTIGSEVVGNVEVIEPDPNAVPIIGRLIEVFFHEKTPDGSLRHPRFKRFRSGVLTSSGKE